MHSDTFISSSDYKSGAWPSGKLRFEQIDNHTLYTLMFETYNDQCEFSVKLNKTSQDQNC